MGEILTTELAAGDELRVIAGGEVSEVKRGFGIGEVESVSATVLAKLRASLGADLLATGSYTVVGEVRISRLVRLDVRLQDTRTGEIVGSNF